MGKLNFRLTSIDFNKFLSFILHEIVNNIIEEYGRDQWFSTFPRRGPLYDVNDVTDSSYSRVFIYLIYDKYAFGLCIL